MGSKAFEKNRDTFAQSACNYRVCQDSILALLPFMKKRKILCSLDSFKRFIFYQSVKHDTIEDSSIKQMLQNLPIGPFVVIYENNMNGKKIIDALCCHNFKNSVTVMCSKELIESYKIRYIE